MSTKLFVTAALAGSAVAIPFRIQSRTAGSIFQYSQANADDIASGGPGFSQYQLFQGDGSVGGGWPDQSAWISFQHIFDSNADIMKQACTNNEPGAPDTTDEEIGSLWNGIQDVARQTGVDHRFILAVIMQESRGCVRIHTTVSPDGTVVNPGMMQDHNGAHSCNNGNSMQTPCPPEEISGMILDGAGGTNDGAGLAELLNIAVQHNIEAGQEGTSGDQAQIFYQAARLYNSGETNPNWADLNDGQGATACYAMDIANRLVGWNDLTSANGCAQPSG